MLKKKTLKIHKAILERFKRLSAEEMGLKRLIGIVVEENNAIFKEIRETYNLPKEAKFLKIDHEKSELTYHLTTP